MALWLMENCYWTVISYKDLDNASKDNYGPQTLIDMGGDIHYHIHDNDSIAYRTDPDLIQCIETLQALHQDDDYTSRCDNGLFDLSVEEVRSYIRIEDYYDGKERIVFEETY